MAGGVPGAAGADVFGNSSTVRQLDDRAGLLRAPSTTAYRLSPSSTLTKSGRRSPSTNAVPSPLLSRSRVVIGCITHAGVLARRTSPDDSGGRVAASAALHGPITAPRAAEQTSTTVARRARPEVLRLFVIASPDPTEP
jgi:hypothetical protein